MCKKPTFTFPKGTALDIPLFKPISSFEPKHYIKKLAQKIKVSIDTLDFDSILNERQEDLFDQDYATDTITAMIEKI
jgi:hypothetical protein